MAKKMLLGLIVWPLFFGLACNDQDGISPRARELNQNSFVFDAHCDTVLRMADQGDDLGLRQDHGHMDLPRMVEGGLNTQVFAMWVARDYWPDQAYERTLTLLDAMATLFEDYPEQIELALTATDAERLYQQDKIAAFLGIEGGHAIEDNLDNLAALYDRGVRLMTLTWMYNTNWADASGDISQHDGLTEFGEEVIREMNRLGMLIDLSHAADSTFYNTLAITTQPVVASHSCTRALCEHHRNLTDDMLMALAQNGGVIGINYYQIWTKFPMKSFS